MKHCVCMCLEQGTHPCHFLKKCGGVDYSWPIMQSSCHVLFLFVFLLLFLIRGVPNGECTFSQDAVLHIKQLKL